jgi:biopolymer transport protein ExbB
VLELFRVGGVVMWPLLALSALAVGIILERFWTLRRKTVLPPNLTAEVLTLVRGRRIESSHIDALRQHSPLGKVLATALAERHRPHEKLVARVENTGREVVHGLSRWLNTLGTIAIIGPMMGLLGTVIGMIRMFLVITDVGTGDATRLAGGIGEALMATAFGLVVAIPAYIFHRYFRGLVQAFALEMARDASQVVDALETPAADRAATAAAPAVRAAAPVTPAPARTTR